METTPSTPSLSPKPKREWLNVARLKFISAASLVLICVSAGFLGGWLGASSRDHQARLDADAQQELLSSESELISSIASEVGQSVVSVNVLSDSEYTDFYGFTRSYEQQSAGTGIIISGDVVITNRHVVPAGVTKVSVILSDGTELENVTVLGRTSEEDSLDVAFLKINDTEGRELKAARLGDSSAVKVGDQVVAIGNALGQFQNTVTQGIISGYGRNVEAYDEGGTDELENLFQTDAAINQGNSGGPLVNMAGEVIGINTAVAGGAENIGFSIPINDVKGLVDTVLETGKFERPYLGVRYVSLTDDIAAELELSVKRGAYIPAGSPEEPSILPDSPAAAAGLRAGDVITHVNGQAIDEHHSLSAVVSQHRVGEEVTVTVWRDGASVELKATLAAL